MKQADRTKFADLLAGIYALYRAELTTATIEIWWHVLQGYDLEAISDALARHVANPDTGQFIPKPADVVKMFGGTTKDAAILAWAKVDKAVREIGTGASVVFDDPIIHRILEDLGGWTWLGRQTEKEWPFVEKRFVDHYRSWKLKGDVPPHPQRLVGWVESTNNFNGYREAPVDLRLIGDAHACKLISSGAMAPKPFALPERIKA